MTFRLALSLVLVVFVSACGATRPAERGTELPTPDTTPIDHGVYETFDPSRYPEDAPTASQTDSLVHDVPAALLGNRPAEAGGSGVVFSGVGYRVQVFQSTDKQEADRAVTDAVAWWNRSAADLGLLRTPEVYTVYRAPFYRVRVGNFQTRGDAQRIQAALNSAFNGAFLVQDRVTVRR